MFSKTDRNVRITLDRNIRCQRLVGKDHFNSSIHVGSPANVILEIKSPGYFPYWLAHIIKKYSLRRQAISKYALAVQDLAVNSSLSV